MSLLLSSRSLLVSALLTAGFVTGCGSDNTATPTNDAGTADTGNGAADVPTTSDAAVDTDATIGTFQVALVVPSATSSEAYTSVVGRVSDGPTPAQIVWSAMATDGDCRLMVPRVPFCATPCGGGAVCVEDNTCRAFPTSQSVGAVQVSGVRTSTGASMFDLTAVSGSYQLLGDVTLAYPGFAEGDMLRVSAAGSTFADPFTLEARGIAQLVLGRSSFPLTTGQPLALTWTAPGASGTGSSLRVRLDISHHGGTRGKIECTTTDDGELSIGASLISQLVALGVAGYPTVVLSRVSSGTAQLRNGRVEFLVSSEVEVPVEIPNLRSCTQDSDCTTGTCRADLTCG